MSNIGLKVRMSEEFKERMMDSESRDHILEFENSVGIIEVHLHDDTYDVRWEEGFKYMYDINDLTIIK